MKRILTAVFTLLALLGILILILIKFGMQKQEAHPVRIGVLNYTEAASPSLEGFREGMAEHGYREGIEVEYVYRGVIADPELLREEAERLVSLPVDLIFAMATLSALTAQKAAAGTDIPIVFGPVSNPVEGGILQDPVHPEKNTTGVMFGLQEEKRLGLLKEFDPTIETVYVPYNPDDNSPAISIGKLEPVRIELGLEFIHAHARTPAELREVMEKMPDSVDAVYIPTDPMMAMYTGLIADIATQRGVLSTAPHVGGVEAGALYSYSFEHRRLGSEAARLSVQILEGVHPENLPVEMSELRLAINLATADRIGLKIPDTLLRRAAVFE